MTTPTHRALGTTFLLVAPALVAAGLVGCGEGDKFAYKPKPAYSGKAVSLPAVPTLPKKPKKNADGSYTVWGAIHDLRSRVHGPKLVAQESVSITGYIIKTNLGDAPPCAVHKGGKADGKECEKTPPPIPAFWIADDKASPPSEAIAVMGWASNFAKIYDAIEKYKKPATGADKDKPVVAQDDMWSVAIPNPIPAKDAKVKVTGKYGTTFTLASQGMESNPLTGIMTYKEVTYLEPPPVPGTLPGMK